MCGSTQIGNQSVTQARIKRKDLARRYLCVNAQTIAFTCSPSLGTADARTDNSDEGGIARTSRRLHQQIQ
jgi:hypothetical protein